MKRLLCIIILVAVAYPAFCGDKKKRGNTIFFNDNAFETIQLFDTVIVTDPVTGKLDTDVRLTPSQPFSVNGEKIYAPKKLADKNPKLGLLTGDTKKSADSLKAYLLDRLVDLVPILEDGGYCFSLTNVVINSAGKLVYYDNAGLQRYRSTFKKDGNILYDGSKDPRGPVPMGILDDINNRFTLLIDNMPHVMPLFDNRRIVPYLIPSDETNIVFMVKDHALIVP